LQVKGFKNLADVTVRFGPLTCFVGSNGVGKSNLFDAIHFLKLLAEHDIQDAAARVRRPMLGSHSPLDLFFGADPAGRIQFEADLLVPREVLDDFERPAQPSVTVLRYSVAFRFAADPAPRLELVAEELTHLKKAEAEAALGFPTTGEFRRSVLHGVRRGGPLISTDPAGGEIRLHQDGGSRGQPFHPGRSPRTIVGGTNTYEYPTVLAARREMASWRFVHLEPRAMRSPDPLGTHPEVKESGEGVAAALHAISHHRGGLQEIVNELKGLNEQVDDVRVDRDEAREHLVVAVKIRGLDRWLGPRSLSDGTLRYLALVTMKNSPSATGLWCMEEPENGMHPSRVPALVSLLRGLAVDATMSVDPDDNPLRQVLLNSHSPDVVRQLDPDDILLVTHAASAAGNEARVHAIRGGWRGSGADAVPPSVVEDFIGGSPLGRYWDGAQSVMPLRFGTAR